jgi:hypothetical protein
MRIVIKNDDRSIEIDGSMWEVHEMLETYSGRALGINLAPHREYPTPTAVGQNCAAAAVPTDEPAVCGAI